MIGFVVGTVCLIGLIKVLRHGRRCGYGGYGYGGGACGGGWRGGWGGHGFGGHGGFRGGPPWARRGGGFGKHMAFRWLFELLDTTPGQEKVIMATAEEARGAAETARGVWQKARADVARAVRGESVDEVLLAEASARLDAAGQQLREAISAGLTKIHAVLDEEQRVRFSELIADGPGFFGGGFGGRHHHGYGGYRGGYDV
jgi:Spy/CpxP family protein refolding chaperone